MKTITSSPKPKASPKPAVPVASNPNFAAGLIGVDIEAGEFDPFELSAGRSEETLLWWRAAELKHARICMLAALGLFVQPLVHLPDAVFDSVKGYGAATQVFEQRPWAIWQILIALAAIETSTLFTGKQGAGGDFDWDPLDLRTKQNLVGDKLDEMKLRELKNGRLAMLGTAGMLVQEFQTGGLSVYEQLN
jgi:light-harvesting complex I chlorophyll a/b binding protein 1